MVAVNKICNAQCSHGPAVILAISTATPPNFISQADYPDFCLRITNSDHMTDLKEKFKRMLLICPTHYRLTKLLGLRPSIKRLIMYQQGYTIGDSVLRLAKDLAENNRGARVLDVCSEITALFFCESSKTHVDSLVGQALFGDGATAIIVGADPDTTVEHPIFQLFLAAQTILRNSSEAIKPSLREAGLTFYLQMDVPNIIISMNIEKCLVEAFTPIGINNWNSIFWIMHPGGRAIVDQTEEKLGLDVTPLS